MGLGLAIVKSIVAAHRGTITFRSDPGIRTVFEISFPVGPDPINLPSQP